MTLHVDLHCHSRFSADGVGDPEELVESARARGLHGLAITDHNTCEAVEYCLSKGLMRKDGLPVDGFLIVPGQEVTTREGHLLSLGITLPDLKGMPAAEAVALIHSKGGLAIPSHPYDLFRAGIREEVLKGLPVDAIEVFNAANTFKLFNQLAQHFAKTRHLPMFAASDAHHPDAIGVAYTILETDDFSVAGVLEAVRRGGRLHRSYLTFKGTLQKTFHNLFRKTRRKIRPSAASPRPRR